MYNVPVNSINKQINNKQTHTHVGFYGLQGFSIGVMVFILYKPYFLSPYTNPTPKPTPYRKLYAFLDKEKIIILYDFWYICLLNYGDTENVLINHLHVVIPMSYPCHYTICVLINHTHTHTHTHRAAEKDRDGLHCSHELTDWADEC